MIMAALIVPSITFQLSSLPLNPKAGPMEDWLVEGISAKVGVYRTTNPNEIVLSNGIVSRTFRLSPNAATVAMDHLQTRETFLRAPKPEAWITLNGEKYAVGGLTGQPNHAFLTADWLNTLKPIQGAFQFEEFEVGKTVAPFKWKRVRHSENRPWPAPGASLTLTFRAPEGSTVAGVRVEVRYELYDGAPIFCKSIRVINESGKSIQLDSFISENLSFVERQSTVDGQDRWLLPNVSILSDYAFGGFDNSVHCKNAYWLPDPEFATQVNYERTTPCLLEVHPPKGPNQLIEPGKKFDSFRTFEILHDSDERERRSLALRRFYRMLSPWATENPIMLHLTSVDPKVVLPAIDQAAECGFEMVIISFWSGLDMENLSAENLAKFKEFREYANKKGVELGGYSLLASRSIDAENDVINEKTGKPGGAIFGSSPCFCSKWGIKYFETIRKFMNETGFQLLEHDGNYPGDHCASKSHTGHTGLEDSQWNQWTTIRDFYRECRANGTYLNVPDWYFLTGSNKTGMGYRESNWSLPRAQQHIHARQNLFDGTWDKTPTMGWMMTPLVEYQGGGKEATIEPLKDHLQDYEQHLLNNFGFGAQSCYRGPRLYDSPETKKVVIDAVQWFKQHRAILESDVIHIKRADGRNVDAVVHVNPNLPTKAMLVAYNPSEEPVTTTIAVPLYSSGVRGSCRYSVRGAKERSGKLDRKDQVQISITIEPKKMTWVSFR
jgi:hypothetical protein